MPKILDLKGQEFGRLKVIKYIGLKKDYRDKNESWFLCKCKCGNKKEIKGSKLKSGWTKSCGCYMRDQISKAQKIHGLSKSNFNYVYSGLYQRCNNPNNPFYKNYGGRGIKCLWSSFIEFKNDMYQGYLEHCNKYGDKNTTIERINNDGHYCKENCRWATREENANNKRSNIFYTYKGKSQTKSQWAKDYNLTYRQLEYRLYKGYSIEGALKLKK